MIQGDTDQVSFGRGSFGSRTATVGGSALRAAADRIIERGKRVAAHFLEADEADIGFEHGRFVVAGTDRSVSLQNAARATYQWGTKLPPELASGLEGVGHWSATPQNYPNGCYVVEVEVDPETGVVRLDRIAGVDDVGRVINPLLLEGQVHGSIAQGAGQALLEQVVFDESGPASSPGRSRDYAMPRADDFPPMVVDTRNVPTKGNPLGVKGGAETGHGGRAGGGRRGDRRCAGAARRAGRADARDAVPRLAGDSGGAAVGRSPKQTGRPEPPLACGEIAFASGTDPAARPPR